MNRVRSNSIPAMKHAVEEINIYANEGDIYTVGIKVGNDELTVCDKKNKPLIFKSLALAKAAFKKCKGAKTSVICSSPYDEMIGHDKSG